MPRLTKEQKRTQALQILVRDQQDAVEQANLNAQRAIAERDAAKAELAKPRPAVAINPAMHAAVRVLEPFMEPGGLRAYLRSMVVDSEGRTIMANGHVWIRATNVGSDSFESHGTPAYPTVAEAVMDKFTPDGDPAIDQWFTLDYLMTVVEAVKAARAAVKSAQPKPSRSRYAPRPAAPVNDNMVRLRSWGGLKALLVTAEVEGGTLDFVIMPRDNRNAK